MTGRSPQLEPVQSIRLPGLDGSNPLGFLAALGLLRALDHRARMESAERPRLRWIDDGYWQPEILGAGDFDAVVHAAMQDKGSWEHDPAFLLAYDESGHLIAADHPRAVRDLKPKPPAMREFLSRVAGLADDPAPSRRSGMEARRSLYTAASYGSELIQDRTKGNTKPLAFHFAAGQQTFLDAAAKLREGITEEDLREALLGPWKRQSKLPSMSWDATTARIYALRASDPSGEKRGSTAGADWLAFVALGLLLVTPHRRDLITAGVRGGWKGSTFTWALWNGAAGIPLVRAILTLVRPEKLTAEQRLARGIGVVFSSAIVRSDQGGYGSFSPSRSV
jgi:hypothetical protein